MSRRSSTSIPSLPRSRSSSPQPSSPPSPNRSPTFKGIRFRVASAFRKNSRSGSVSWDESAVHDPSPLHEAIVPSPTPTSPISPSSPAPMSAPAPTPTLVKSVEPAPTAPMSYSPKLEPAISEEGNHIADSPRTMSEQLNFDDHEAEGKVSDPIPEAKDLVPPGLVPPVNSPEPEYAFINLLVRATLT